MWPFGVKVAFDLGLIVAGTGLLTKGKDRLMDDVNELKEQIFYPEQDINVYEVNDFETVDF